jgi:hypothetical protein
VYFWQMAQRYKHIADVMQAVAEEVKKFTEENKAAYYEKNGEGYVFVALLLFDF